MVGVMAIRCVLIACLLAIMPARAAVDVWPWSSAEAVAAVLPEVGKSGDPWRAVGGWLALATIGDPLFDGVMAPAMAQAQARIDDLADPAQRAIARAWSLALGGSALAAEAARSGLPESEAQAIAAWIRRDAGLLPTAAADAWSRAIRVRAWTACGYSSRARYDLRTAVPFASGWVMREIMRYQDGPAMLADLRAGCAELRARGLSDLPTVADDGPGLGLMYLALRAVPAADSAGVVAQVLADRLALLLRWHADDPRRLAPSIPAAAAIAYVAAQSPQDPLVLAVRGGSAAELRAAMHPRLPLDVLATIAGRLGPHADQDAVVYDLLVAWRDDGDAGVLGRGQIFAQFGSALRWNRRERLAACDPWAPAMRPYAFEAQDALADLDPDQLDIRARWQDATIDRDVGNGMWPHLWLNDRFGIIWSAQLIVPTAGRYRFATDSDDASVLTVADEAVVDNRGVHGIQRRSGLRHLPAGRHRIEVRYLDVQWGARCHLFWQPPGATTWTILPADSVRRADEGPGWDAAGGLLPVAGFVAGDQPHSAADVAAAEAAAPWSRWRVLERCRWAAHWHTDDRSRHLRQLRDEGVIDPWLFRWPVGDTPAAMAAWDADLLAQAEDLPVGPILKRQLAAADVAGDQTAFQALADRLVNDSDVVLASFPAGLLLQRGAWAQAEIRWRQLAEIFPEARLDVLATQAQQDGDWQPLLTALAADPAAWRSHHRRRQHARWLYEAGLGEHLLPLADGDAALVGMAFLIEVEQGRLADAVRRLRHRAVSDVEAGILPDLRRRIAQTRTVMIALTEGRDRLTAADATWLAEAAAADPYWRGWAALINGELAAARAAWTAVPAQPETVARAAAHLRAWCDIHGESGRWALLERRRWVSATPWRWL